ncbi:MAG: DNA-binding protein [Sphingobacteriales bacterium]|nr:DNA-binding protein [Sphingobacteriales bacterium]
MKYLLDTHVCLWAIADKDKLSLNVKKILEDGHNRIFVSQISLFEIAIKLKIDKLP